MDLIRLSSPHHKVVLDPVECALLRTLIQERGELAAAEKLGIARNTVVRAALGLSLYAMSANAIREALSVQP